MTYVSLDQRRKGDGPIHYHSVSHDWSLLLVRNKGLHSRTDRYLAVVRTDLQDCLWKSNSLVTESRFRIVVW